MKKLILASTSKPRELLLQRLQIPFTIAASHVDETPLPNEAPVQLVMRLAEQKARAVANDFPAALIIGADQVGILGNEILCKPLTHDKAIQQLQNMSGKRIRFLIGLCVLDTENNKHDVCVETFDVTFRQLDARMIENYLQKEAVLNCAGSFKAEGLGIALVEEFHDTDFTAVIGLPLIRLVKMLEKMGLSPI